MRLRQKNAIRQRENEPKMRRSRGLREGGWRAGRDGGRERSQGHVDENPPGQETMAGNAGPDETVTPSTAKNLGPPPVATPAGCPSSPLTALATAIAAARMGRR